MVAIGAAMTVRLSVSLGACSDCGASVYHVEACNEDDDVIAEASAHSVPELVQRISEATAAANAQWHGVLLVLRNIPADIRSTLVDSIIARQTHEVEA